jgi:hypothetical protein
VTSSKNLSLWLVFPHQLFDQLPEGVVSVAVMEEQLFFNQYAFHKQKLVFHRATGANTVRVYNPVKNGLEHDGEGEFVRRWVPEITGLPNHLIHQPWTMTDMERVLYGVTLGEDYPQPVVALQGRKIAMVARIYEMRKTEFAREEKARVLKKHSRPAKAKSPKMPKASKVPKAPKVLEEAKISNINKKKEGGDSE